MDWIGFRSCWYLLRIWEIGLGRGLQIGTDDIMVYNGRWWKLQ